MGMSELNVVTGAFGYTGKYITQRLLAMGRRVRTLTGHPDRPNPFGPQLQVKPYNFDNPHELAKNLEGARTLYNTYWVRFAFGRVTFEQAVANTKTLIRAAEEAGVQKFVQLSVTNASEDSSLPYFRGKGILEGALKESKLSYAIIRPTLIFGVEDILINNIAWLLRKFPVFGIPGWGHYRVQPVFAGDVAEVAVAAAAEENSVSIDGAGVEVFTFLEMVRLIAKAVGSKAKLVPVAPRLALLLCKAIGYVVRDVILTREELEGLMASLLITESPPTGRTCFRDWLAENAECLGRRYASELDRHYRWKSAGGEAGGGVTAQ